MEFDNLNQNKILFNEDTIYSELCFCFDQIIKYLSPKLEKIGYKKVISSPSNLEKIIISDSKEVIPLRYYSIDYNNLEINTIGIYNREIEEARTDMVDVLGIYDSLSKDILSSSLISGKNEFNENEYLLVNVLSDKSSKIVASSEIVRFNDKFIVKTKLNKEMLLSSLLGHIDLEGLIYPSNLSLSQIVIIPIKGNEVGVLKKCRELKEALMKIDIRTTLIDSQNLNFNEEYNKYRKLGVPLIIGLGPKDFEIDQIELFSRINKERITIKTNDFIENINNILNEHDASLYKNQLKNQLSNLKKSKTFDESINQKVAVCSSLSCIDILKKNKKILLIPFNQQMFSFKCVICNSKATKIISVLNY